MTKLNVPKPHRGHEVECTEQAYAPRLTKSETSGAAAEVFMGLRILRSKPLNPACLCATTTPMTTTTTIVPVTYPRSYEDLPD